MPINWGQVISTGIGVAGKYLTMKESEKTARYAAKYSAQQGGGMNLDTIVSLIQMGQGLARPQSTPAAPYPMPSPGYPVQIQPGWPTQPPSPIPSPSPMPQIPPTTGGPPMLPATYSPQYQTAPYVAAGAGSALVPYAGQAFNWLLGGNGTSGGGGTIAAPQAFYQTQGGVRAKSFFNVAHPNTGNLVYYRNCGKPILFSGDLTACKRVNKVASRARRASPRKRTTTRRRR